MKRYGFVLLVMAGVFMFTAPQSLNASDYRYMSCYELWYARNKIFADEGYCFTTRRAIRTFGRRCYPPYGRLTRWERDEVDLIKRWEYRKGCR